MFDANIKYNRQIYDSGLESFISITSDKPEKIHVMLFNDALKKYFEANGEKYNGITFNNFLKSNNIIDLRSENYMDPSKAIISSKSFPYRQEKIDLTQFWNNYQIEESNKDINDLIEDDETVVDAQLVYIDYARNKCKFRSKTTGKEFWSTLDYVNSYTIVDDDELTLKGTFSYMLKNM